MSTPNSYENKIDATIAATNAARTNGYGYAFAVEWADHWSVEPRKPCFRGSKDGRPTEVVECRENGERLLA